MCKEFFLTSNSPALDALKWIASYGGYMRPQENIYHATVIDGFGDKIHFAMSHLSRFKLEKEYGNA